MPLSLEALAPTQRTVLTALWTLKGSGPSLVRMPDATYMLQLLSEGWCLNPSCDQPPLHCHWPIVGIINNIQELLEESNL